MKRGLQEHVRLMVCGSAALPLPMMSEWAKCRLLKNKKFSIE